MAVHGDKGTEALGHQLLRKAGHDPSLCQLWPGALGFRYSGIMCDITHCSSQEENKAGQKSKHQSILVVLTHSCKEVFPILFTALARTLVTDQEFYIHFVVQDNLICHKLNSATG